jgi:general secretion pathway protein G
VISFKRKGFTVIEMMMVIAILSLLSSIVLISLRKAEDKAIEAVAKANVNHMKKALEMFYITNGFYPFPDSGQETSEGGWSYNLTSELTPDYIPRLPIDPKNRVIYTYESDGSDNYDFYYTLFE